MKVPFKRKKLGVTDYRNRLRLVLSKKPRLIIRKGAKNIIAQLVEFNPKGDNVLLTAHTRELIKFGWKGSRNNTSAAYLIGLLVGIKAKEKGIKDAILDIGLYKSTKGSILYSTLKGALDAGIKLPYSENILPSEDRIKGNHIVEYAKKLDKENYQKQFSGYIKLNIKPEEIAKHFEDVKNSILKVGS